jgi:hypothetical protein
MAKSKTTVEKALNDFTSALIDAAKILKEDLSKLDASADEEEDDAPVVKKGKVAKDEKPSKSKKAAVEEDDEDDADDEDEEEDDVPKKGKAKPGKKAVDEDDEDEEDGEDDVDYADVQKAVVKAAKANGRDFVAERLKRFGKKVDHASKLKPEQFAEFIEALNEDADDEEDED